MALTALSLAQLHPCKCAGSIRYVHQECLDEWLSRTNSVRCELCHQPFLFSPVYVPNTPDVLSVPQFLVGECLRKLAGTQNGKTDFAAKCWRNSPAPDRL